MSSGYSYADAGYLRIPELFSADENAHDTARHQIQHGRGHDHDHGPILLISSCTAFALCALASCAGALCGESVLTRDQPSWIARPGPGCLLTDASSARFDARVLNVSTTSACLGGGGISSAFFFGPEALMLAPTTLIHASTSALCPVQATMIGCVVFWSHSQTAQNGAQPVPHPHPHPRLAPHSPVSSSSPSGNHIAQVFLSSRSSSS